MRERFETIDFLRGISIIFMMFIHSTIPFTYDSFAFGLSNIFQFVVATFVFCSAYLFYKKEAYLNINHTFSYFKKRLFRLLAPYYIFLPFLVFFLYYIDPY